MNYTKLEELMELAGSYIHKEESLNLIRQAYEFAEKHHEGQFRKSGEKYIIHPLNVACILTSINTGPATICAGLLHDLVEDTDVTLEEIEKLFGKDVAEIVDGVTKVGQLEFNDVAEKQATNQQHMLLAMAKDIRVVIVKLADRLHNIRTLGAFSGSAEKQRRIAKETLDIYAPLAHKLGMFRIKAELEDTALKYVDKENYNKIASQIKNNNSARMSNVDHTIAEIREILDAQGIKDYQIKGRIKNIYSIYKKMMTQNKDFKDIYDILAIRIILNTVGECYQVLGLIHAKYTPIPKRFKDYIAVPKPNMYQSLHTTVISVDGFTFEVQIRTYEMDKVAELGVAAHWAYKENVEYSKEKEQFEIASKLKWYGELMQFTEEEKSEKAKDYVDAVKEDILGSNVYVYTPTGEVIDLPKGATPIDFAYKIHTGLGNKMVGAIVNNHIVPLNYELKNGDLISIKTNKNSFGPSENWLKIAKTAHAKHKIKSFLNKQNKDVLIAQGKSMIDEEFRNNKITNYEFTDEFVKTNFTKNNVNTVDEMYLEVAKSNLSPKTVIARYTGQKTVKDIDEILTKQIERNQRVFTATSETGVVVEGLPNPQIKLGSCCTPIPGDEIIGYVTKGNGIVVHHVNCKNLKTFQEERFISLYWAPDPSKKYQVSIKIEASTNNSLLVDIMNTVSASNMQILAISANNGPNLETVVKLKVLTHNLDELEKMIVNLKKIKNVFNIERDNL